MKKMFFAFLLLNCTAVYGQVAVNLPSDRVIDPLAALQVVGRIRIDTLPPTTIPTHVLVLDVANDSVVHSMTFASFVSFIYQSIPNTPPIIRTYTTDAVWTKPVGLKYIVVEMVGGGGGGGGCYEYGGGSGAAGGYCKKIINANLLSPTESILVGVGGTGGAPQFPGSIGGTSSFGSYCLATGGEGGKAQTTTVASTNGSLGGVGVGGDINSSGPPGGGGVGSAQPISVGASSYFGAGAISISSTAPGNGFDATGYGSGGGGANGNGSVNKNGGKGSNGIVIITEYY